MFRLLVRKLCLKSFYVLRQLRLLLAELEKKPAAPEELQSRTLEEFLVENREALEEQASKQQAKQTESEKEKAKLAKNMERLQAQLSDEQATQAEGEAAIFCRHEQGFCIEYAELILFESVQGQNAHSQN